MQEFYYKQLRENGKDPIGLLVDEWRHEFGVRVINSEPIPMMGEDPKAYNVYVTDDDNCRRLIGVVVGSKKFGGKTGWEAWAPVASHFLKSGFGSRRSAAEFLHRLATAMGALEVE